MSLVSANVNNICRRKDFLQHCVKSQVCRHASSATHQEVHTHPFLLSIGQCARASGHISPACCDIGIINSMNESTRIYNTTYEQRSNHMPNTGMSIHQVCFDMLTDHFSAVKRRYSFISVEALTSTAYSIGHRSAHLSDVRDYTYVERARRQTSMRTPCMTLLSSGLPHLHMQ